MASRVMKVAFNLLGLRVRIEAERRAEPAKNMFADEKDIPLSLRIPEPPVKGRYGMGLFG